MVKIWLRKRSIVDNFLFGAADRQNQSTKWIDDLHIKNFQSCFIFVIGSYGIHNNMNSHKLLEYPRGYYFVYPRALSRSINDLPLVPSGFIADASPLFFKLAARSALPLPLPLPVPSFFI